MVVHLSCSRDCVANNIENLRKIIAVVHRMGHVLARDWIESKYQWMAASSDSDPDGPQAIFRAHIDAIQRADLVIIENSYSSFGGGYQVADALHQKKPVLLLVKSGQHESNFSAGAVDPFLTHKYYTEENVEKHIESFIKDNAFRAKDLRFNFVVDRRIHNYLDNKASRLGKTKAEILRELLIRDLDENTQ